MICKREIDWSSEKLPHARWWVVIACLPFVCASGSGPGGEEGAATSNLEHNFYFVSKQYLNNTEYYKYKLWAKYIYNN